MSKLLTNVKSLTANDKSLTANIKLSTANIKSWWCLVDGQYYWHQYKDNKNVEMHKNWPVSGRWLNVFFHAFKKWQNRVRLMWHSVICSLRCVAKFLGEVILWSGSWKMNDFDIRIAALPLYLYSELAEKKKKRKGSSKGGIWPRKWLKWRQIYAYKNLLNDISYLVFHI